MKVQCLLMGCLLEIVKALNFNELRALIGTGSGTRTHTAGKGQRILSPSCLPFHHSCIHLYFLRSISEENLKVFLLDSANLVDFTLRVVNFDLFNNPLPIVGSTPD